MAHLRASRVDVYIGPGQRSIRKQLATRATGKCRLESAVETVVQVALRLWDRLPPSHVFCKSIILIQLKALVLIDFCKYVILKGLDLRQTHAEWAVLYVHEETVRSFVLRMQPGHKKSGSRAAALHKKPEEYL